MNLTHPQLATVRRVIEDMAAKEHRTGRVDVGVLGFAEEIADLSITIADMAVHQEFGRRIWALSREQADLLKYVYIGRRIALQIEALEDRPVDLRAEG